MKIGLHTGLRSKIHHFKKEGDKVILCGLGALGVGALEFKWEESYKDYSVCTGCLQGPTQFKKEGKLKDFMEDENV